MRPILSRAFPFPAYAAKQKLRGLPGVLACQMLLRGMGSQLATRRSRLCIEGFPRSGNTFALACLLEIPGLTRNEVAHHTHNIANVRRALSLEVPTYVLLRDPLAACLSLSVMGLASVEEGIRAWLEFHRPLLRMGDQSVLVPLETLSADPYSLVEAAALAIGQTPPPERADFASLIMDRRRSADRAWAKPATHGSAPDPERNRAKAMLAQSELDRATRRNLDLARDLRQDLLSRSPTILPRTVASSPSVAA